MAQKYKYLHLVNYNTFLLWDIKRYFMTQMASSHPIVKLGDYIQEEGTKYNISDKTKTKSEILIFFIIKLIRFVFSQQLMCFA